MGLIMRAPPSPGPPQTCCDRSGADGESQSSLYYPRLEGEFQAKQRKGNLAIHPHKALSRRRHTINPSTDSTWSFPCPGFETWRSGRLCLDFRGVKGLLTTDEFRSP